MNKSNTSAQIISLPKGGGALHGIGEKFSPDLHTGTGNFTLPIAIPAGRNGFHPQLNLVYSTGNGSGHFGLGWHLSIPGITRQTSKGIPRYKDDSAKQDERDIFVLSAAEDLVPVSGGYPGRVRYRPRTEGLYALIEHVRDVDNDYWEVRSKEGLVSFYGTNPDDKPLYPQDSQVSDDPAVIAKPGSGKRIFSWKLTLTKDPFGNRIEYLYARDKSNSDYEVSGRQWDQPLLKHIRYVDHGNPGQRRFLVHVTFEYQTRSDPFSEYRSGFEIRTTQLCNAIHVETHPLEDQSERTVRIRRYEFLYRNDTMNGMSLLNAVEVVGFDDEGREARELPALAFGYTRFEPEKCEFFPVGGDLPARSLANHDLELVDLFGNGLPDVLEMNGTVRYWRNLGGGTFDLPREMRDAPPVALGEPAVQLIDADGDGRTDLLVTPSGLSGFFSLCFGGLWDRKSFQKYQQAPSFNLEDPEVRLVDLTGDGVTDVIRSGTRLECFFNDRQKGWLSNNTRYVERRGLEEFPNVNFSDPRVKWGDMSGDGLQDIVLVYDGNVEYWPNLGFGDWGRRIHMNNSPRFPYGYDPRRILVGDVDGDGLTDIVYVDDRKVTLWINHSGNSWSAPIEINGTPRVSNLDAVRLIDLLGSGINGVLWSSDLNGVSSEHMFFLDLTGGVKPYLMNEMNNHMGAVTRVEYAPSSRFFLEDQQQLKTRWKTPLPFPVQVVASVEVIDRLSQGKLTTEYHYHHGYWDGAEREFRGFGMVEQLDTEAFDAYNRPGLHGEGTPFQKAEDPKFFSPPTLTKTWFHQGPIGEEFGDWAEADYSDEYWDGDPPVLGHIGQVNAFLRSYNSESNGSASSSDRRIKRDALRALRGSVLRTEIYARDSSPRANRPYAVKEYTYGLREEFRPTSSASERRRIFFPHLIARRTTQWERGDDPMTEFAFTGDYDPFGQPQQQTVVAMPRRADKRLTITGAVVGDIQPDETKVLATHTFTAYATPPASKHLHNRLAEVRTCELLAPPAAPDLVGDDVRAVLEKQLLQALEVRNTLAASQAGESRVINHVLHHYDGEAFTGLPAGQLGEYGALVRTETLVLTDEILRDAYADGGGNRRPRYLDGAPAAPDAPPGFGARTGYRKTLLNPDGGRWYIDTQRQRFDFQAGITNPRGLLVAMQDALGNETRIEEYDHQLLPTRIRDAASMQTTADYNYRVLQPARITDPNGTSAYVVYSPLGLPLKQFVRGIDAHGNETLGGTEEKPEIRFLYDFLYFEREGKPIFVQTQRRIHHASDDLSDDTIDTYEYSDGYGRIIQTRVQAEEWIFGETGDDVGLPGEPGAKPSAARAIRTADSVVVSGWQIYDNKGRVIEKYEPFFSRGMEFEPEADAKRGQHVTMFYDPRGNLIRTINPDGSQQRVILGRPAGTNDFELKVSELESLDVPDSFEPTPWETYTYDANDLAPLCLSPGGASLGGRAPAAHHFTPASAVIDALGRARCQVQRNGATAATDWFVTQAEYDLRGNALKIIDALGRVASRHAYDLVNQRLRFESIDAGLRTSVLDANGNPIEYRDSKGSLALRTYDALNRRKEVWACNNAGDGLTLRERIHYGDEGNYAAARMHHTLGRPVQHYDEAGLLEMYEYDFKGNLLEKSRRTIRDSALANGWLADWNATGAEEALEGAAYQTSSRYDALNRVTEVTYPTDVDSERKQLIPRYNRAGALEAVSFDDADYVQRIAYSAKGQRLLVVYGNNVMTRYVYDPHTFRLARLRTERVTPPGLLRRLLDFLLGSNPNEITFRSAVSPLQDFGYTYDLAGNVTAIDERVTNCGITGTTDGRNRLLRKFNYDPIHRLTEATGRACRDIGTPRGLADGPRCGFYPGGPTNLTPDNAPDVTESYSESFTYDPAGNMLELSYQGLSTNWKRLFGMADLPSDRWQDAQNNRLTSLQNGSIPNRYRFDANGNLLQQNLERHHVWDHADRMVGYRVQPDADSPASIEARYLYGADGMRVKKWVRKGNSAAHDESTVYIDDAFEHHKWTANGVPKENNHFHVMEGRSRIAIMRAGDRHPLDGGERVQYHLADHLGSSSVVVGGDRATANSFINREEYFPFGETSFGSFGKKRYRYSGKERDEETALYYFGARYYESSCCRWISCDSTWADGVNLYVFVHDSPVRFLDTTGLQSESTPEEIEAQMSLATAESDNLQSSTGQNGASSTDFAKGVAVAETTFVVEMLASTISQQHAARKFGEYVALNLGGYVISEEGSELELESAKGLHRLNPVYQIVEGLSEARRVSEEISEVQARGQFPTFEQGVGMVNASNELGSGVVGTVGIVSFARGLVQRPPVSYRAIHNTDKGTLKTIEQTGIIKADNKGKTFVEGPHPEGSLKLADARTRDALTTLSNTGARSTTHFVEFDLLPSEVVKNARGWNYVKGAVDICRRNPRYTERTLGPKKQK